MSRPAPVDRAYYAANELLRMLETCLDLKPFNQGDRLCCLHAYLRLRHVCELYARDDDPDAFEEYYLLLFDALGFLTTAWQLPGERRRLMAEVVRKLHAVRRLYQNS